MSEVAEAPTDELIEEIAPPPPTNFQEALAEQLPTGYTWSVLGGPGDVSELNRNLMDYLLRAQTWVSRADVCRDVPNPGGALVRSKSVIRKSTTPPLIDESKANDMDYWRISPKAFDARRQELIDQDLGPLVAKTIILARKRLAKLRIDWSHPVIDGIETVLEEIEHYIGRRVLQHHRDLLMLIVLSGESGYTPHGGTVPKSFSKIETARLLNKFTHRKLPTDLEMRNFLDIQIEEVTGEVTYHATPEFISYLGGQQVIDELKELVLGDRSNVPGLHELSLEDIQKLGEAFAEDNEADDDDDEDDDEDPTPAIELLDVDRDYTVTRASERWRRATGGFEYNSIHGETLRVLTRDNLVDFAHPISRIAQIGEAEIREMLTTPEGVERVISFLYKHLEVDPSTHVIIGQGHGTRRPVIMKVRAVVLTPLE
jgi:hypothetical protein